MTERSKESILKEALNRELQQAHKEQYYGRKNNAAAHMEQAAKINDMLEGGGSSSKKGHVAVIQQG